MFFRSSLVVGFGVIGTAVNRYYYKLSGTDQIPFKGTFQAIFNFIQVGVRTLTYLFFILTNFIFPDLHNTKIMLLW